MLAIERNTSYRIRVFDQRRKHLAIYPLLIVAPLLESYVSKNWFNLHGIICA